MSGTGIGPGVPVFETPSHQSTKSRKSWIWFVFTLLLFGFAVNRLVNKGFFKTATKGEIISQSESPSLVNKLFFKTATKGIGGEIISQSESPVKLLHLEQQTPKIHSEDLSSKVISCYYNLPKSLNSSELMPREIDPHLCTHINAAFATIKDNEIYLDVVQIQALKQLVMLREINRDLKILLSVGGSGDDNGFPIMVANHTSRKVFIKSIKYLLRNLTLDGIDLDWEFPVVKQNYELKVNGGRERQHFSQLLQEIRKEYIREKKPYLLTVAAAAPQMIVDAAYDVDQLNEYTDYVNIMTYDFHFYSKATPFTGLNSPLYARHQEKTLFSTLNINYTVNMYIEKGLSPSKIVVGIPTYGHSYHLINSDNPSIGSPSDGYGTLGATGFVSYPEICNFLKKYGIQVTVVKDKDSFVPYLYWGHEWVSYDTPESVDEKAFYIMSQHLGGAMVYSLNADDHTGSCSRHYTKNPRFLLTRRIKLTFNDIFYNIISGPLWQFLNS